MIHKTYSLQRVPKHNAFYENSSFVLQINEKSNSVKSVLKARTSYMKIFYYSVLLWIVSVTSISAAPGDFVKNVKIPSLSFEFPEVQVFPSGKGTEVYFYRGENSLSGTWRFISTREYCRIRIFLPKFRSCLSKHGNTEGFRPRREVNL